MPILGQSGGENDRRAVKGDAKCTKFCRDTKCHIVAQPQKNLGLRGAEAVVGNVAFEKLGSYWLILLHSFWHLHGASRGQGGCSFYETQAADHVTLRHRPGLECRFGPLIKHRRFAIFASHASF
jgi:hypothetical protein